MVVREHRGNMGSEQAVSFRSWREHEREDARESDDADAEDAERNLVYDEAHGEWVDEETGEVFEDRVDRGPEWRASDAGEYDRKARVGAPRSKRIHDEGLATDIDWRNRDAYGNALSSSQRKRMNRLRTWNQRAKTRNGKERSLREALGEIDRMASALGLPESVREVASVIFRRAHDEDLVFGRSIEGVATSALYAAARQAGVPRSIEEFVVVTRVDRLEFERTYRYVVRELGLEIAPADPGQYLPRFASDLDASDATRRYARQLLDEAGEANELVGKNPVGIVAGAIYAAALLSGEELSQNDVSDATGISEVTIRKRYRDLLELHERAERDRTGATCDCEAAADA